MYDRQTKTAAFFRPPPIAFIPCIALPAEKEQPIGLFGRRHLNYLKQHHRVTYISLLTSGKLNTYLADVDRQAQECFEQFIEVMKQAQGITELKLGKRKS